MALYLSKGKTVKIVDRTLPEISAVNKNAKRLDIIDFCWMLRNVGVDLVEINSDILKNVGKLPAGIDFLYRINPEEDIEKIIKQNIKDCIIKEETLLDTNFILKLSKLNLNLTVEFKINTIAKLYEMKKLKSYEHLDIIREIRVTGLSRFTSLLWIKVINEIEKLLDIHINICPENRFFNATALAVDGIMNGFNSFVLSFTGYGRDCGYAALEEVLLAVKILISPQMKVDLTTLPALARRFVKLTGISVPESKPILGKSIFKYESGIHADGIEKNPITYEPYEPDIVGQKRNVSIGKHSGRKSIISKLKELGVDFKVEEIGTILAYIRDKSIELKRDLHDSEIREVIQQAH